MKAAVIIGAVIGAVVVAVGGMWMLQDRLLYFPGQDPGPAPESWAELRVVTGDGVDLTAWLRVGDDAGKPIVAVFPGNGGNRAGRLPLGNGLAAMGYSVVLVEYRGYGGNPGRPSEAGLITDALAAVRTVRGLGLADGGLVYFGESMGAAVAIAASVEEPPDALILGSPFTSIIDVGRHHYPWLPVAWLARDRYPSLERVEQGALDGIPVLIVAGTADRTVPIEQSRAMGAALGATMYEIDGADHNDPSIRSAAPMVRTVAEFVDTAVGR